MRSGSRPTACTPSKKVKKPPAWLGLAPPYQVAKDGFTYRDIQTDYDGWIDPDIYRPEPYELVLMKMERKTIAGWWNGIRWEGLRLMKDDKVLYWKVKVEKTEE